MSQRISFSRNSDLSSVELNLLADLSRLIVTVAITVLHIAYMELIYTFYECGGQGRHVLELSFGGGPGARVGKERFRRAQRQSNATGLRHARAHDVAMCPSEACLPVA